MTVNAAHVLGLPDRGRIAVGLRADIVLLDAPDWRHLAYHLAGEIVHTVDPRGPGRRIAGIIRRGEPEAETQAREGEAPCV